MTNEELADVLATSKDPLELARAGLQIEARRLAEDVRQGRDTGASSPFKKSLEELRRTEQGYLEIAVTSGKLIERDVAKALAGNVAARFIAALDRYEAAGAKQVEIWLSDPEFTKLDSEGRGQKIRAWFREKSRAARRVEAADLERWVVEEQ